MGNEGDKRTGKLVLFFIVAAVIYLAFFHFDLGAAYNYTVATDNEILRSLGF